MLPMKVRYRLAHCLCSPPASEEQNDRGPEGPLFRCIHCRFADLEEGRKRLLKARTHGISLILPMLQAELAVHVRHLRRELETRARYHRGVAGYSL